VGRALGRTGKLRVIAGLAVASLALAACGSSNTPAASTTSAPATSSAASSSSAPAPSSSSVAPSSSDTGSSSSVAPTSGSGSSSASGTGTPGKKLEVGLAFDTGGRGDGTFNDSAATGADKAKKDLGVDVTELEASSDDDRPPNLPLLTSQKKNPIITVGFLWSDTLTTIAKANPDTTYAIVDSVVDLPNVKSLVFAEEQGSFLVGAAAALKTKSNQLGFIGGQEGALIKRFEAGFIAGAKAVNPDIKIESQYLGPEGDNTAWSSPDKAKTIAKGWYDSGVDIIYSAAGGSGAGTIEAAVEAGGGKWAIGVDSDQYLLSSDAQKKVILTSMLKRVDEAVYQTIEQVQNGDTTGGVKLFDLKVDGVGYSTSGGYLDDVKDKLEDYKAKIVSGEIKVPTDPAGL
jgi:basic membrane protein A and related proteins